MNSKDRIKNKVLLKKIMDVAIKLQNEGRATVFFEISGHVNWLKIMVYAPVWSGGADATFSKYVNTYDTNGLRSLLQNLIKT